MTLIEILAFYRDLVRVESRREADVWLRETCDEKLWDDIKASVSDEGKFLDAEGFDFNP